MRRKVAWDTPTGLPFAHVCLGVRLSEGRIVGPIPATVSVPVLSCAGRHGARGVNR